MELRAGATLLWRRVRREELGFAPTIRAAPPRSPNTQRRQPATPARRHAVRADTGAGAAGPLRCAPPRSRAMTSTRARGALHWHRSRESRHLYQLFAASLLCKKRQPTPLPQGEKGHRQEQTSFPRSTHNYCSSFSLGLQTHGRP
uniref:Uncharacterized protein n=1 Tax=Arundo donax TaxID=35708 RepID=A0A0A9BQV6_ARUDO